MALTVMTLVSPGAIIASAWSIYIYQASNISILFISLNHTSFTFTLHPTLNNKMKYLIPLVVCLHPIAFAAPSAEKRAGPAVNLDYATITGSSLLGINFAQPPVGQLRLKPPQPVTFNLGTVIATGTRSLALNCTPR